MKRCAIVAKSSPQPSRSPQKFYISIILSLWSFAKWGFNIIGPLPLMLGKVKFTLVAADYYTKWAEAEAFATIDQDHVIRFIWRNIICRFGLPQAIVSDNGKQFDCLKIDAFYRKLKITKLFSTPYHPPIKQPGGAINKIIKYTVKTRLQDGGVK